MLRIVYEVTVDQVSGPDWPVGSYPPKMPIEFIKGSCASSTLRSTTHASSVTEVKGEYVGEVP